MRLLASTDLALRVLMLLAADPPGRQLSVEALSRELGGLSRHHLHKIVQDLAAYGAVHTTRGAGGGVRLAMPPDSVRLGELIRHLEGDQPIVECFRADGGCCSLTAGCRLRGFLGDARESFYRNLDGRTLAECLPRPLVWDPAHV
ncbi:MAG TPA: Rrf2 family transcriptional regulator [Acetobacteraceae bacterium]|nr:Rrf2 family transcriptional regulator [Acetobacteraceae bacterium]